ncbi:MAG: hypothetical protein ABF289_02605 [Clostridiales bacterium]
MFEKVYIDVFALFKNGKVYPKNIIWTDGKNFEIDKILDIRRAAAQNVGGLGLRYTCRIRNKVVYIWLDENIWFLEIKR